MFNAVVLTKLQHSNVSKIVNVLFSLLNATDKSTARMGVTRPGVMTAPRAGSSVLMVTVSTETGGVMVNTTAWVETTVMRETVLKTVSNLQ